MSKRIFSLCLVLILSISAWGQKNAAATPESTIDNADRMILGLKEQSEQDLQEVERFWKETEPLLSDAIKVVGSIVKGQQEQCDLRDQKVAETEQQIQDAHNLIDWINKKKDSNQKRLDSLEGSRCTANSNFINGIKNNKIAITLIQFLKKAISEHDSLTLLQKKAFISQMVVFIQLYKENHFQELLELRSFAEALKQVDASQYQVPTDMNESKRSAEEIGTGHVDNNRDKIKVKGFESSKNKDWATYKADLLKLLDDFEANLKEQIQSSMDAELGAGIALADFKIQVDREARDLDHGLIEQNELLDVLQARLIGLKQAAAYCKIELGNQQAALNKANDEYNFKLNEKETKKNSILEEYQVYGYVYNLYHSQIASASDGFRARVDDYSDNKKFDNAYGDRQSYN